jgi:hypothetical protein
VAVTLVIQAWVPPGLDLDRVKEGLRAVAVQAGCEAPRAAIAWYGREEVLVEVRCGER